MEYVRSLTDALGLTSAAAEEQGDAPNPLGDPIVVNVDDQSECFCVCARAEEGELGAVCCAGEGGETDGRTRRTRLCRSLFSRGDPFAGIDVVRA